jgi:hypothetical protein
MFVGRLTSADGAGGLRPAPDGTNQRKDSPQLGARPADSVFVTALARSFVPALLVLAGLAALGCSSRMSRAQHAFDEGRYPDAVGELRSLEADAAHFSPKARARYALMRGLTHLSCGDTRQAARWLSEAKLSWERDPSLFNQAETGRLLSAWRSMGLMPGEELTSALPAAE